MKTIETDLVCRLLCASQCAKGVRSDGSYDPPEPYHTAMGWDDAHGPVGIVGGKEKIDGALIGANGDGIILAFRGTLPVFPINSQSLLDWWEDIFDSKTVNITGMPGKVDEGFWDAIDAIWQDIIQEIGRFQAWYPDAPLILTGHSKGGPMASLTAARLYFTEQTLRPPQSVCTFASPHAGDREFVEAFPLAKIPVTRYENYLDIVPFLPSTGRFLKFADEIPILGKMLKSGNDWGYEPLGKLCYVSKDGDIRNDSPGLNTRREEELLRELFKGENGLKAIANAHHIWCGSGYCDGVCTGNLCQDSGPA